MAIYYVSDATGNDSDDGLSEANAKLTIAAAVTAANSAGDSLVAVKADGTYTPTGNVMSLGGYPSPVSLVGYSSSVGDNGLVTVDASGMTAGQNCFQLGDHCDIANIKVVDPKNDGFYSSSVNNQASCRNCYVTGTVGNQGFENIRFCVKCFAETSFYACGTLFGCVARTDFRMLWAIHCALWTSGSGRKFNNFYGCINCSAYGGGFVYSEPVNLVNCVSWGSDGYAFDRKTGDNGIGAGVLMNCAYGSATSGVRGGSAEVDDSFISLSADPFDDIASLSTSMTVEQLLACFLPNTDAGGGALLRGAGFP